MDKHKMKIGIHGIPESLERSINRTIDKSVARIKELIDAKTIVVNHQSKMIIIWVNSKEDPNIGLAPYMIFVDPKIAAYKTYAIKKPENINPKLPYICDHAFNPTTLPPMYHRMHPSTLCVGIDINLGGIKKKGDESE